MVLTYYDMPGKADAIRFALAFGVPFIDRRLTMAEADAEREAGRLDPFGQLPMLHICGNDGIAQSDAVLRLAARLAGNELVPSDPVLAARADQWVSAESDFSYPFLIALFPERCYLPAWRSEDAASYHLQLLTQHIPRFLRVLEEALAESPTGWLAHTAGPSIADLCWAPRLQWLESGCLDWLPCSILHPYPLTHSLIARVHNLPEVAAWRQEAESVRS